MHINPSASAYLHTFSLKNKDKLISIIKLPVTAVFSAFESIKTGLCRRNKLEETANAIVKAHFDSNSIFVDPRHQAIHDRIENYKGKINVAQLINEAGSHDHDELVIQAMLGQFSHNFILFANDFLNFYQSYFADEEIDISIPVVDEILNQIAEQIPQNIVKGKQEIKLEDLYVIQYKLVPNLSKLKNITEEISQYRVDIPVSLITQLKESTEHLTYAIEKTTQLILDFIPSLPEIELNEIKNIFERWKNGSQDFHERFICSPKINTNVEGANTAQSTYKKLYEHYLTMCQENAFFKTDNKLVTSFNFGVVYHKLVKLRELIREERAKPDWKHTLDERHILELEHFVNGYINRYERAYNTMVRFDLFADQEEVKEDLEAVRQILAQNSVQSQAYKDAYDGLSLTLTDDLLKKKLDSLILFHQEREEYKAVESINHFQSAFERFVLMTKKKPKEKIDTYEQILGTENKLEAQIVEQLTCYQTHIDKINNQAKEDIAKSKDELEGINIVIEKIKDCWNKKTDLECQYVNTTHKLNYYTALFDLQTVLNSRITELNENPSLDLHESQNLAWLVSCIDNYLATINLFYKPILKRDETMTSHFSAMRFYYDQLMQNYDYHTYEAEFGNLEAIEQRLLKNIAELPADLPYKFTPRAMQVIAFTEEEQENNYQLALEEYEKANAFLATPAPNFAEIPKELVRVQEIEKSLEGIHSQIELIKEPAQHLIMAQRAQFKTNLEQKNISFNKLEQIAFIEQIKNNSLFTKEEIKNDHNILKIRLDIILKMSEKGENFSSLPYFERYKNIFAMLNIQNDPRIPNEIRPLFLNLNSAFLRLLAQTKYQDTIALQPNTHSG